MSAGLVNEGCKRDQVPVTFSFLNNFDIGTISGAQVREIVDTPHPRRHLVKYLYHFGTRIPSSLASEAGVSFDVSPLLAESLEKDRHGLWALW